MASSGFGVSTRAGRLASGLAAGRASGGSSGGDSGRIEPGSVRFVPAGADLARAVQAIESRSSRKCLVAPTSGGWRVTVTPQFADDGV